MLALTSEEYERRLQQQKLQLDWYKKLVELIKEVQIEETAIASASQRRNSYLVQIADIEQRLED